MDTIKGECDAAGRSWRAGADHAAGMTAKLAGTLRRAGDSRSASRIGNPEKPDTGSGTSNTIVAEEKRVLRDDLPDEEEAIWQTAYAVRFRVRRGCAASSACISAASGARRIAGSQLIA